MRRRFLLMASRAEQGVANFDISLWFGMWALAGTPPAVGQKLNAQVNAVAQLRAVREQLITT